MKTAAILVAGAFLWAWAIYAAVSAIVQGVWIAPVLAGGITTVVMAWRWRRPKPA